MMPAVVLTGKAIVVYRTRLIILLSLLVPTLALSGCNNIGFPGVYLINIDQGNIVDQEMVDQLKPEMTRRQVRFLLGTPIVEDTFNNDRWDYIRLVRRGNDTLLRRRLTVVFENDVLVDVEGDLVGENWPEPDPVESADDASEELSEKTPDQGANESTAL
ncbi:outer membrane protein assembly factor BamE [Candidatus Paraluminiphilus aquimaris]|jgi:outer membrane protein assembly factor BamE|nr:outer membrane protein assembly factor BamE [Candidatus Paraluminiphilus aquimaris]